MKKFLRFLLVIFSVWLFINAVVFIDVYLRAKSAYEKGLQYLEWAREPNRKKEFLDKWLSEELKKIKTDDAEAQIKKQALETRYEMTLAEDNIVYARRWFETVVECFSPPETKYVKKARKRLAELEKNESD